MHFQESLIPYYYSTFLTCMKTKLYGTKMSIKSLITTPKLQRTCISSMVLSDILASCALMDTFSRMVRFVVSAICLLETLRNSAATWFTRCTISFFNLRGKICRNMYFIETALFVIKFKSREN